MAQCKFMTRQCRAKKDLSTATELQRQPVNAPGKKPKKKMHKKRRRQQIKSKAESRVSSQKNRFVNVLKMKLVAPKNQQQQQQRKEY